MAQTHPGYPDINRAEFMAAMRPYFAPDDMEQIETAYRISKYAHRTQERDSGIRYFEHPKATAWIAFDELHIIDWKLIVILLLHDVIEDSYLMSVKRMGINFGADVALAVQYLSKEADLSDDEYWRRISWSTDWRILIGKLIDRLHNLRTLGDVPREKQGRKVQETIRQVLPLWANLEWIVPDVYLEQARVLNEEIEKLCAQIEAQHQEV